MGEKKRRKEKERSNLIFPKDFFIFCTSKPSEKYV